MSIFCSDERSHSNHDAGDEPGARPAARPDITLGGWRPAHFAAAASRPTPVPQRAGLGPRAGKLPEPVHAIPGADRFSCADSSALPPFSFPSDGCKEGLAGLFSLKPRARPLCLVDHRMDFQPRGIRIETERLVLRVLGLEDFDDYAAVSADPATFRFSERGPMSSDEAWTRLLRHVGHWALMGWGLFAVEEKATGRFVGEAGLGDFRRGLGSHYDGVPEAAWTIAPWAQGHGYATEAMAAALAWVEQRLGAERSVCLIHVDNAASRRVADKLGYKAFAECTYRGYDALLFERQAPLNV